MEEENKTQAPSPRENLLARARERFSDRTFDDLGVEQPSEGAADLDEAIDEMLTELINKQTTYDEKNARLTELLMSDPSAAEYLQRWVETKDPRTALVETFGDELGMSEEAQAGFQGNLESWRERKAANDAIEAQAQANWDESLAALESWGDERGLSMENKRDIMLHLLGVTYNGQENKYGPEEFEMAWHAMNYDNDVAAARAEGQVAGRNERIEAARRDRSVAGAMPPAASGSQGGRTRERRPEPEGDIWDNLSKR
jgi:hypothetical protein